MKNNVPQKKVKNPIWFPSSAGNSKVVSKAHDFVCSVAGEGESVSNAPGWLKPCFERSLVVRFQADDDSIAEIIYSISGDGEVCVEAFRVVSFPVK